MFMIYLFIARLVTSLQYASRSSSGMSKSLDSNFPLKGIMGSPAVRLNPLVDLRQPLALFLRVRFLRQIDEVYGWLRRNQLYSVEVICLFEIPIPEPA